MSARTTEMRVKSELAVTRYESCQLALPRYDSCQSLQVMSTVPDSSSVCHCGVAVNTGRSWWLL